MTDGHDVVDVAVLKRVHHALGRRHRVGDRHVAQVPMHDRLLGVRGEEAEASQLVPALLEDLVLGEYALPRGFVDQVCAYQGVVQFIRPVKEFVVLEVEIVVPGDPEVVSHQVHDLHGVRPLAQGAVDAALEEIARVQYEYGLPVRFHLVFQRGDGGESEVAVVPVVAVGVVGMYDHESLRVASAAHYGEGSGQDDGHRNNGDDHRIARLHG